MPIDEKFHNALLQSLSRQRNAAHDTSAQIEASLNVAIEANGELQKQVSELTKQLEDARKTNAEKDASINSLNDLIGAQHTQLAALQQRISDMTAVPTPEAPEAPPQA